MFELFFWDGKSGFQSKHPKCWKGTSQDSSQAINSNAINCTICTCNTLNLPAIRLTTISPIVATTSPVLVSMYHLYLWASLHSLLHISKIRDHYGFQIEFHGPSRVLVENCGDDHRRPHAVPSGDPLGEGGLVACVHGDGIANCFGGLHMGMPDSKLGCQIKQVYMYMIYTLNVPC